MKSQGSHAVRTVELALLSTLFLVYVGTATYDNRQNIDTLSTLVPAWQLASHGNVYADQYLGFTPWFVEVGDHVISNRLPGAILWGTPFYFLLGRGGGHAPLYPAGVASAAAAALSVFFLYCALLTISSRRVAAGAALVFALVTPTWSVSADSLWTHGPAQLCLALSLLWYSRERYAQGGLAQAAAILVRPHLALVPLVMGCWAGAVRRSLRTVAVVGATSALGVAGLAVYYWLVYGNWTLTGGYGTLDGRLADQTDVSSRLRNFANLGTNVSGALVSPGRGLLVYSPFLLLLLPGIAPAWRLAPPWVRSAAVAGILYAFVQLGNNGFTGGDDLFGYRLLLEPLTMWTPLLTLSYVAWTGRQLWRKRVFAAVLGLTASTQAGAAIFHIDFAEPTRPWSQTGYRDLATQHPLGLSLIGVGIAAISALAIHLCRSMSIAAQFRSDGASRT